MNDAIAYRPLECLTMIELEMLQRMATRYSEVVREHAYLVGLMNLAVRTGDTNLLATAKRRLVQTEIEYKECTAALEAMKQELSAPRTDGLGEGLPVASQVRGYATA